MGQIILYYYRGNNNELNFKNYQRGSHICYARMLSGAPFIIPYTVNTIKANELWLNLIQVPETPYGTDRVNMILV